jgi:hypothetical protein
VITGPEPRRPGERPATCARRGISRQPVRPYNSADKGEVERAFDAVRTQFSLHVAGYTGHRSRPTGSAGEGAPG